VVAPYLLERVEQVDRSSGVGVDGPEFIGLV
jgi:hypothetical protein